MSVQTEPSRTHVAEGTESPTPPRRPRRWTIAVAAMATALGVTAGGYALAEAMSPEPGDILGPGIVTVTMDIENSRFSFDQLIVEAGTLVAFEVANLDPIHHELVVGPPEVHARHRVGTEQQHPPVPGEVSLDPNTSGMTFYSFERPGSIRFTCHLPGHESYGMTGTIEVVPAVT